MAVVPSKWLDRVFGFEGAYSDDPSDPGGETKFGISKRAYPHLDIAALTREQASEIYAEGYARPFLGLPAAVGYQLFDFAVNAGSTQAVRHLQLVLGVAADGKLGPKTHAAVSKGDARAIAEGLLAERLAYYTRLDGWARYGKGWARRISWNLRYLIEDSAILQQAGAQ